MRRQETEGAGRGAVWTEDEDFYLSQGYAMFHDDRSANNEFAKTLEKFPFREKNVTDLTDRWRHLNDQLEQEDLETVERIRKGGKHYHRQTWTYRFEPPTDLPECEKILKEYDQMPSLSKETQILELPGAKVTNDHQNINEMCLNCHFDTLTISKLVQEVFQKTIGDDTLMDDLMRKFMEGLATNGRALALKDFERKIRIISEMTDQRDAETEAHILLDQFKRIFNVVSDKSRHVKTMGNTESAINICKTLLRMMIDLQTIQWPVVSNNSVETLKRHFRDCYFQSAGHLMMNGIIPPYPESVTRFRDFISLIIRLDTHKDFEQRLTDGNIRNFYVEMRAKALAASNV